MDIVKNDPPSLDMSDDAHQADAYARMMEELLIDIDELDPSACPPDRRFFLKDKEAWIYEHGNIAELVYVRTVTDEFDPD
ncbi:MAG: hypothetical protein LJE67_03095 [Salaquimonas sp.]|jgi:hypothetical protein|nr:hypothetical protein [Salaquimonas sp.]